MLFPVKHENMTARRWPVITLGLIALNILVFLATHGVMDRQDAALSPVEMHLLVLAARHPELNIPSKARQFVSYVRADDPADWAEMQRPDYLLTDDWDAQMRRINDRDQLQAEMDSVASEYSELTDSSIAQRYAFVPAHPRAIAYLSSTFLHAGWEHLLGNMWFLWLAGFVLEDIWGRPLYLAFYLVAGAVATQLDGWANPGSIGATLGASGAIAGLMGAFLIRFPKLKIRLLWVFDPMVLGGFWRLWVRAYWLLPLWFGMEIYYAKTFGQDDGIAHSAHIGGFAFGALAALAVRHWGWEQKANKVIEEKLTWTAAPEITRASDLMDQGKLDDAAAILDSYLAGHPDSIPAWNLIRTIRWRKGEIPACREAAGRLCTLNLQAGIYDAAWQDYEEFLNTGGEQMPSAVWLELCRIAEGRNDFRRALSEYQRLAVFCPSDRPGLLAQLGAARILLKRLDRPQDSLRFYEAASASAIPHLDLEQEIESGIQETKAANSKSQRVTV